MKEFEKIQTNPRELDFMVEFIKDIQANNMLVWGLGNDSEIWASLIKGQLTFLEHNQTWINKFKKLDVIKVSYWTQRKDDRLLSADPEKLLIKQTKSIKTVMQKVWDVIYIDAPEGATPDQPGRMQSIYTTAQMSWKYCFVHDCNRFTEAFYCDKFIQPQADLIKQIPPSLRLYKSKKELFYDLASKV
jgi:hypothetical protein